MQLTSRKRLTNRQMSPNYFGVFIFILTLTLFSHTKATAQVELKANPIGLLFGFFDLNVDVPTSEHFSVEGVVRFATDTDFGLWLEGAGKYYFNPRMGFDRFYVGPYLGLMTFDDARIGLGLLVGYKFVGRNGLVFEIGLGGGRAITEPAENGFDGTFRLGLGYRFGQK